VSRADARDQRAIRSQASARPSGVSTSVTVLPGGVIHGLTGRSAVPGRERVERVERDVRPRPPMREVNVMSLP